MTPSEIDARNLRDVVAARLVSLANAMDEVASEGTPMIEVSTNWREDIRVALACLRDYIPHEDRELAITVARQVEQAELLGIDAGAHLHETRRLLKLEPQP